ncbi:hypothetical protein CK203_093751 [Vitis vinifera]|uniref:Uncharacterized protein n=1 Tax=Vitis vinifera TaxID=29760 RepID=A0A438DAU7_VITVI|nr:hypothetical protein CK203_093751 [Vitis vinifera]
MAMAAGTVASTGAYLMQFPRTLAALRNSFIPTRSFSKLGFHPLWLRTTAPVRKLQVRAARTESKGVSLGFRAPHFELQEPLTGKMWTLEDFESYPALLERLGNVLVNLSNEEVGNYSESRYGNGEMKLVPRPGEA